MKYVLLEGEAVDNGVTVDDAGGIYVVTSKYMRKLVWNGEKLSDRESDGAWKSEYDYVPNPKAMSRRSGDHRSFIDLHARGQQLPAAWMQAFDGVTQFGHQRLARQVHT